MYGAFNLKIKENPRIVGALPDLMLKKWREIEERGGTPVLKKRRYWGVEDEGPGEPLPFMEAPSMAPDDAPEGKPKWGFPGPSAFKAFDPATLQRRDWLFGRHYLRGTVSITAGLGGRGKSSLDLAEAVSLATCRNILGEQPAVRCRVWYHCGDDTRPEVNRRIAGLCQHHKIPMSELEGWLFTSVAEEFPLRAAEGYSQFTEQPKFRKFIDEFIGDNQIGAATFDPLVTLHGVFENDAGGMHQVIDIFRKIAGAHDCAVELVHHMRKGLAGQNGDHDASDMRGSVAIHDAVRAMRVLNIMGEEEAGKLGINSEDRRSYVRVDRAKANYARLGQASWVRLTSVSLPNGDEVQAVEAWQHSADSPESVAAHAEADRVFLMILRRYTEWQPPIAAAYTKNSHAYAPRVFAGEREAADSGLAEIHLEGAMMRLLKEGKIRKTRLDKREHLEVVP